MKYCTNCHRLALDEVNPCPECGGVVFNTVDIAPAWLERSWPTRCPEVTTKRAGDESWDICGINEKPCLLDSGMECKTYEEFLRE